MENSSFQTVRRTSRGCSGRSLGDETSRCRLRWRLCWRVEWLESELREQRSFVGEVLWFVANMRSAKLAVLFRIVVHNRPQALELRSPWVEAGLRVVEHVRMVMQVLRKVMEQVLVAAEAGHGKSVLVPLEPSVLDAYL